MDYAKDKQYTIPAAFTALNGCAETYKLTAGVDLVVEPEYDEDGEMTNADAVKEAQANLLRVLEVLRSNGAQPIITKVDGKEVEFTVEQSWVWGLRGGNVQVSARKPKADAELDIEEIFGEIKAVDGETKLFGSVEFVAAVGNLVKAEDDEESES